MTPAEAFKPTVIVTSFNHRDYLIEAVESVLNQTMPVHEIIIADDCSTDGSQSVIEEYRERNPQLIRSVLQETNVGIPRNRNSALQLVSGTHVGILDGDDYFLPDKTAKQFEALQRMPNAQAVYGNFQIVDADRVPIRLKWQEAQPDGDIFAEVASGLAMTGILRTLLVRYELVAEVGFMNTTLPMFDGLWLSILLATKCRFAYVDDVLICKRDHPSSDSKAGDAARRLADLRLIYADLQPLLRQRVTESVSAEVDGEWRRALQRLEEGAS